ncbi:MAG: SPFH domain-containing protein [Bacteroidaceae bacterium]|nr:SPFH domain-containing protein [Bacteroidaceae bacterium]
MGLFGNIFGKGNNGGIMDTIRCDEKDFLIWKWRPAGQDANSTSRENAIRMGSSISVRPGQAAVFLYQQKEGEYDVIKGPYNSIVKTDNLPVLASIVGLAYDGGTPFQAELYYFNLAKGMEILFTIPYFRVVPAEPEYKAYCIEVAVKGSLVFEVSSQKEYIKYLFEAWGGNDTTLAELESKVKSLLTQEVKQIVSNAPKDTGIFVMHFNSLIGEMGSYILNRIQNKIANRFGILATDVTISDIRYDENSEGYQNLKRITETQTHLFNLENEKNALLSFEIQRETMRTDADIRNDSARRMADMQLNHQEDMMARTREESQFAQRQQTMAAAQQAAMMNEAAAYRANTASDVAAHRSNLASEQNYLGAHQVNVQADVMKTGLNNMGQMGSMNLGGGEGHMNPAGMMAGMMMGTAVAGQMGNMMNNMGSALNQNMPQQTPPPMQGQTPPPIPQPQVTTYYVSVNGQQMGPFDVNTLMQYVQVGQINANTMAWCNGMPSWTPMGQIPALAMMFQSSSQGGCPPPLPNV